MHTVPSAVRILILVGILCTFGSSCSSSEVASETIPLLTKADLQARLDALQSNRPDVQGFAVAVVLPDGNLISAATGEADPEGRAMTADTPVRIASITKTFVAASILRLWEEDTLDLDATIGGLISAEHRVILASDGYDVDGITIRHLLMHASGLNDHFAGDAFKDMVLSEPTREWTRTDQLKVMVDTTDPLASPGESYAYSDTGYVLLGEVIERITGESLGGAVSRLTKLDEIGLTEAWWDTEETPSENVPHRAHHWLGDIETYSLHGSADAFGGGGVVASVEDVARFFSALFDGDVFESPDTLSHMTEAPGHPESSPYRMGLFVNEMHGHITLGHGGFWGTDVFVVPDWGFTISGVSLNAAGIDDLRQFEFDLATEYFATR